VKIFLTKLRIIFNFNNINGRVRIIIIMYIASKFKMDFFLFFPFQHFYFLSNYSASNVFINNNNNNNNY